MKITKSLGAALAAAFMFVGCGIDVPEAVTTIDYVYDENGVLTVDHDGGIPEGAVTIRVRDDATGETYSVHGSDWDEASRKAAERTLRMIESAVALTDRLVFPPLEPLDLEAVSLEERDLANRLMPLFDDVRDDLPTLEELRAMSPEEREAALDRAEKTLARIDEEIASERGK